MYEATGTINDLKKRLNGHKDPGPPSIVKGAGTFMRSYESISYTLDGILPSGYLYGLTAKQGSGKTAFMIAAALAVALGPSRVRSAACSPIRWAARA